MDTIKVKDEKFAAKIELEDGTIHKIVSPNFEQLKQFDELKRSNESDGLFLAFEKLGLPTEVSKKLPITVLHKISERLMGGGAEKK